MMELIRFGSTRLSFTGTSAPQRHERTEIAVERPHKVRGTDKHADLGQQGEGMVPIARGIVLVIGKV